MPPVNRIRHPSLHAEEEEDYNREEEEEEDDEEDLFTRSSRSRSRLNTSSRTRHVSPSQRQLERIRRIFLNRPTSLKVSKKQRDYVTQASCGKDGVATKTTEIPKTKGYHDVSRVAQDIQQLCQNQKEQYNSLNIQNHIQSLSTRADELFSYEKDKLSRTQASVDRVIDELKLLQRQEERALDHRVNNLKEAFIVKVEKLEQQFIQQVNEMNQSLIASIHIEKSKSDKKLSAAAERLKRTMTSTMTVHLGATGGFETTLPNSVYENNNVEFPYTASDDLLSTSTRIRLPEAHFQPHVSLSRMDISESSKSRNQEVDNSPFEDPGGQTLRASGSNPVANSSHFDKRLKYPNEPSARPISPLAKTREKLKKLEAKLAAYSDRTVRRVDAAANKGRKGREYGNQPMKAKDLEEEERKSPGRFIPSKKGNEADWPRLGTLDREVSPIDQNWPPTPMSPLRENESVWRRGISFESPSRRYTLPREKASTRSLPQPQFLSPAEQHEMNLLQGSIGLTTKWMEEGDPVDK